jgi:SNF2 family DNA or RNA helicase
MSFSDAEIIRKFCKTENTEELDKLSPDVQKFFIELSRETIKNFSDQQKIRTDLAIKALTKLDPFKPESLKDISVNLTELQMSIITYFHYVNSLLVALPTGYGKTVIAMSIAHCYLKQFPKNKVVVLSPVSIIGNFQKEGDKFGIDFKKNKRYYFIGFDQFMNYYKKGLIKNCNKTLLIIDEAHTLSKYDGMKNEAAMFCAMSAHKVLLLSATPMKNNVTDFISIVNLLHQRYIASPPVTDVTRIKLKEQGIQAVAPIFREATTNIIKPPPRFVKGISKVDYEIQQFRYIVAPLLNRHVIYKDKVISSDFPSQEIFYVYVDIPHEYAKKYNQMVSKLDMINNIFSNPEKFYHGYRKGVNDIGLQDENLKLTEIVPKIKGQQSIVFTNWIEYGLELLEPILKTADIKYGIISSKIEQKNREELMRMFNRGDINTMIITKAGSEGLDFKNVRNVVILDPVWNPAGMEQIIGRAVRYKSHDSLPIEERHVNIYLMILKEPNVKKENSKSGDVILYRIISEKIKILKMVKETLSNISKDSLRVMEDT